MLKISITENETKRLLILEGKLVTPWTDEVRRVCGNRAIDLDHRELVIDVRGLTVIGTDGEDLLLALIVQGAKFRGKDVYTNEILKRLARKVSRNGSEKKQRSW